MDQPLVVVVASDEESCTEQFLSALKVISLVLLTYGLMILMFEIW